MRASSSHIVCCLLTVASSIGPAVHATDVPAIDVVVALDNSGSMARNDPHFLLRGAVSHFAEGLRPSDRCSIVIFGDGNRTPLPLKSRSDPDFPGKIDAALNGLSYREPYTDIPGGFADALYELRQGGRDSAQRVIVLFTDGVVDLRDRAQIAGRKQWLVEDLRREAEGSASSKFRARVFGIAFTPSADLQLLQSLATATHGDYKRVDAAADLEEVFSAFRSEMFAPMPEETPRATSPAPQSHPSPDTGRHGERGGAIPLLSAGALACVLAVGVLVVLLFRRERKAEAIPKDQRGCLRLLNGGPALEISRVRTLIGRENTSDIALHEETVSQPHASIEFRHGGFYLRDLRSRDGTFIHRSDEDDPRRLDPGQEEPLRHGDIIRFGKFRSYQFETLAGGQTIFEPGTRVLPKACSYHPARPPTEFCAGCGRALCDECFANHSCSPKSAQAAQN